MTKYLSLELHGRHKGDNKRLLVRTFSLFEELEKYFDGVCAYDLYQVGRQPNANRKLLRSFDCSKFVEKIETGKIGEMASFVVVKGGKFLNDNGKLYVSIHITSPVGTDFKTNTPRDDYWQFELSINTGAASSPISVDELSGRLRDVVLEMYEIRRFDYGLVTFSEWNIFIDTMLEKLAYSRDFLPENLRFIAGPGGNMVFRHPLIRGLFWSNFFSEESSALLELFDKNTFRITRIADKLYNVVHIAPLSKWNTELNEDFAAKNCKAICDLWIHNIHRLWPDYEA